MNKETNDGGQPFPVRYISFPGMCLRDWFAGMALQATIGQIEVDEINRRGGEWVMKKVSKASYGFADAMIAERDRKAGE